MLIYLLLSLTLTTTTTIDPYIASPTNNVEMAGQSILNLVLFLDAIYNIMGIVPSTHVSRLSEGFKRQ